MLQQTNKDLIKYYEFPVIPSFTDKYDSITANFKPGNSPRPYETWFTGYSRVSGVRTVILVNRIANYDTVITGDVEDKSYYDAASNWMKDRLTPVFDRLSKSTRDFNNVLLTGTMSGFGYCEDCGSASLEPYLFLDVTEGYDENVLESHADRIILSSYHSHHCYVPDIRDRAEVFRQLSIENNEQLEQCSVAEKLGRLDKMPISVKSGTDILWTHSGENFILNSHAY